MCGLAGVWLARRDRDVGLAELAGRMAGALAHRGPDDHGVWADEDAGLALGHRRLSIIDLSAAGAQPMVSGCGRWVLAFNGEIYNFETLRSTLEARAVAVRWRGRSDTEVLLELIAAFGVDAAARQCDGMFAFAVWDREQRVLTLGRDRFGEKPLYYGLGPDGLYFGSELSALTAVLPREALALDPAGVQSLLSFGQIPAPLSIFQSVRKLEAGSLASWSAEAVAQRDWPAPRRYWWAVEAAARASYSAGPQSEAEAVEALGELLSATVKSRLVADVPLGAMLSGGVDSTLIAALAQRASAKPISTFTVGFESQSFDETAAAAAAAARIGSNHAVLRVSDQDAIEVAPRLCEIYSEPFADPSQIPTYLVSRALRREVTVALSGDGGDELFGGYVRHRVAPQIWNVLRHIPFPLRRSLAQVRDRVGVHRIGAWLSGADGLGEEASRTIKGLELIDASSPDDLYRRLVGRGAGAGSVIAGMPSRLDLGRRIMLADTLSYLGDDILTKVDRASMASSLEVRAPFLSRALFDFAWSLPSPWLSGGRQTKRILRKLGGELLPGLEWSAPKRGFAPPLDIWLRGPLRDWGESLIDRLDPSVQPGGRPARALWSDHLAGRGNHASDLWPALMLADWRRHNSL